MGLGGWRGGSQDVCLPMSRDSERKRRGEWDERREEGDRRRREGEHLHAEKVSCFNRIIENKLLAHVFSQICSSQHFACMYFLIEISSLQF